MKVGLNEGDSGVRFSSTLPSPASKVCSGSSKQALPSTCTDDQRDSNSLDYFVNYLDYLEQFKQRFPMPDTGVFMSVGFMGQALSNQGS